MAAAVEGNSLKETLMSNKNVLDPIRQLTSEASPVNGLTTEPQAELCPEVTSIESEIAARAYRLWLERGCPEGSPEEDWFLAERELLERGESITAA